ncbi:MAG: efflux RND transporter periplasmic adaptor subunit [Bacteroidales bacterium]|nr:efflux RND transporter periplasmic adaptor subunit [Bacteroidales bacterium]
MKRFNTLLIATAALIMMSCGEQNQNTQQVVTENPKVTVATVNAENVSQLQVYPTTIEADIVNNIAPQASARISKIYVEIGDKVNAGQTLAKMDAVNLEKARLQLVNDSIEFGRIKQLHEIGATSQSDYEAMTLKYDVSKKTYKNLLENTVLKSPISGIVTARNYDEGDMYAMAQPLFVIQKINPVKMLINISESKYSQIKKGMEVDITTDAYGDQAFKGTVDLIYPTINSMTHTFPVEVKYANKDMALRPGMFARVTVNYGDNFRVVVPDRAVLKQVGSGEQYVYVLNDDGTVTYTVVELGRRMGNKYEVISGLDDNATVVMTGQTKLKNGIAVEVVK